jgi:hypothetical protein
MNRYTGEIPEAKDFRERITREDDLFNTRTTVFLITNGLLLTSVGLSSLNGHIQLIISILGLIISIAWLICSLQTWKVIKNLNIEYIKHCKENYIEDIVQRAMFKSGWKRPTELIAKPLPVTFIIAWIVLLIICLILLWK